MNLLKIFLICLSFVLIVACRKDKVTKNITVNGTVVDIFTNTPVEGVKVVFSSYFAKSGHYISFKKKYSYTSNEATTDANGNFSINDIEIHSNEDFEYSLKTGDPYVRRVFPYPVPRNPYKLLSNIAGYHYIPTMTSIDYLHFQMTSSTTVTYPDTITLTYKPKSVLDTIFFGAHISTTSALKKGFYHKGLPTGWWLITINKTKNAVNTITKDSFFLKYGAQRDYTINF